MIIVSRLNGETLGVNADLIERLEAMPDTVITLVDGKKILVRDSVDELIEKVLTYRAAVLRQAYGTLDQDPSRHAPPPPPAHRQAALRLVPGEQGEQG